MLEEGVAEGGGVVGLALGAGVYLGTVAGVGFGVGAGGVGAQE